MTKEELLLQNEDLKSQIEDLECEIDGLNEYISELENENFELSNNHKADYIKDFEAFKNRLFSDGTAGGSLHASLRLSARDHLGAVALCGGCLRVHPGGFLAGLHTFPDRFVRDRLRPLHLRDSG